MCRLPSRLIVVACALGTLAALLAVTAGEAVAAPAARAAAPAPIVRGFTPAKGPSGTVVTVNGRYFTGASAVKVGPTAAATFSIVDDRTLTFVVGVGATTGPVSVTTPSGTGVGPVYTVDDRTVRGFAPTSGPPGTIVTLNGFNFLGTTDVRFDGVSSPAFAVIDDRTIMAEVPLGAGVGPITVREGGATGTSLPFTYDPVTRIRGFSPISGGPGTVVTINGLNFLGASGVDFGTVAAWGFTVLSNTQIRAIVPYGAVLGQIVVHGVGNDATFGQVQFRAGGQPVSYPLTASLLGTGAGDITSAPAGISCPGACAQSYSFLTLVTLTAAPRPGSSFAGWTGDCSAATGATCTVEMSKARAAAAIFVAEEYPLSVTRTGTGTGDVTSLPVGILCGAACATTFLPGTLVDLTAAADAGSVFAGWSGACSGTATTCSVTMDAAKSVTATFDIAQPVVLSVARTGTGGGTVTSSPAGISCGAACSAGYTLGSVVTLTATPDASSTFTGWSGACSGAASTCVVTMDASKLVTATFTEASYPLTVTRSGPGTVTSSPLAIYCGATCSASFGGGAVVTLTATPDAGASFTGWTGDCTGTSSTCVVTMSAARAVSATFAPDRTLTVTRAGTGSGTVTSAPAAISCGSVCSATYADGALLILEAVPASGSVFTGWSGACTGVGHCILSMDADKAVTATFTREQYTLTTLKAGAGSGTVTSVPVAIYCGAACTATLDAGDIVSLTATPDASSTFTGWSGACSGTGTCTVTMDAAKSVTATFGLASHSLTVVTAGPGSGSVGRSPAGLACFFGCTATYFGATSVTLTPAADAGSVFAGWSGDCSGFGTCTVTMDADRSVTASFILQQHTLTVTRTGTGSGTVTSAPAGIFCGAVCADSYAHGDIVVLSATPDASSTFAGWTGACTGTGACVVTMDAAKSVTATFTEDVFTLTVSRSGPGTVTSSPIGIYCGASCAASYSGGTVVTLTATPDPSASFAGWTGACTGSSSTCSVTMSAARAVTATFVADHNLSVVRNGTGSGAVSSSPSGISCGAACLATYADGTVVTLTAVPASGSVFDGWTGACTGVGTCTVTMDAAKSVTATFTKRTFGLTVTRSGPGTVTSSPIGIYCGAACSATFDDGEVVTLTATPDASASFTGWTGACTGSSSTCTVTMSLARAVTATFVADHDLAVARAGSGSGTVTSSPAGIFCGAVCLATYSDGSVVTLTATPDASSTFAGWTGACTGAGTCTVTMDAAKTVTATFTDVTYTLTVTRTGPGTVTSSPIGISCGAACAASYSSGTVVVLTATPDAGASFTGWSGACTGTSTTCSVTMSAAKAVSASFALDIHSLSVTTSGLGSGTVGRSPAGFLCGLGCTASYFSGTTVTLTATPDAGSSFAGWTGDCTGTGTCTLPMAVDHFVTATFTLDQHTLTVARAGTGSGSVTSSPAGIFCGAACAASYSHGDIVSLTATPDASSSFAGWSGACTGTGTCIVTMDAAKAVTATFTEVTYTLTVTRTGPGTVTSSPIGIFCGASCAASYSSGTVVTLTATPDAGAKFTGWSGACTGTSSTCTVTMSAARAVSATFVQQYGLSASRAGTGSGTVTSAPAGISCGAACTASYDSGTIVTLTATPDATSSFAGWSGACTGTGACSVTMDAAKSVSATFTRNTYTLTVVALGASVTSAPGGISCGATCSDTYTAGTVVTLTAATVGGTVFTGWSGCDSSSGLICTVTISSNRNVIAKAGYDLAVSLAGTGTGSVTSAPAAISCSPQCVGNYAPGTVVTLTATPSGGSTFAGWSGACTGTGTCVVTMSVARSVTATFTAAGQGGPYALSVSRTGTGSGTVTSSPAGINCGAACSASYPGGTMVVLTATPSPGSVLVSWSGCDSVSGSTCTVTLASARSVTATFDLQLFSLSVQRGGNPAGTISSAPAGIFCGASCSASFSGGTAVTLTASGATVAAWTGCDSFTATTCSVTMGSNRSVTASFI